jgi:hypothetical protein
MGQSFFVFERLKSKRIGFDASLPANITLRFGQALPSGV